MLKSTANIMSQNLNNSENHNAVAMSNDNLRSSSNSLKSSLLLATPLPVPEDQQPHRRRQRAIRLAVTVLFTSVLGSVAFLVYGMTHATREAENTFEMRAKELATLIEGTWRDYEHAALSLHNLCRRSRNTTRQEFYDAYQYLVAGGVQVEAAECSPNITHEERPLYEKASREFYAYHYPDINYTGVVGFVPKEEGSDEYDVVPSPPRDFYFIVHLLEPVRPNAPAIELDMYSHPSQKREVDTVIQTRQPVLSKRLRLVQESDESSYGVIIYHPGIHLESDPYDVPKDLSMIVVRMPRFLERVARAQEIDLAVYLYDTTPLNTQGIPPEFLGAGGFRANSTSNNSNNHWGSHYLDNLDEMDYPEFKSRHSGRRQSLYEKEVAITPSGSWIVAVVPIDDTFDPVIGYVLFGGLMILVAGFFVAAWVFMNARRDAEFNEMRIAAETERAALIVKNAEDVAQNERELNDFLAHEVRNPLAAAISASCFITSALQEEPPLRTDESVISVRADIGVINSSLQYANDLLRNMLDMHKASCDQLHITLRPTSLYGDVMEPVTTIMNQSEKNYRVEVNCDKDLIINTDKIRLKQIILNLTSNSKKFLERGFVRIGASVRPEANTVEVFVEDSGPGIPEEKRDSLFDKFQTSLDNLNQGTGYGLSLCKTLAHLMGGEIFLDEEWHSGVEGYPGARFVIQLNTGPLELQEALWENAHYNQSETGRHAILPDLPTTYRVLFVDDDMVLRKLFSRALKRVAPTWDIQEASNGETALRLFQEAEFDLIFIDQYMASIQKQMLGTEAVRALRNKGFRGLICGLSANDNESEFLSAGADAFIFKPFPTEEKALKQELCRIIYPDLERQKEKGPQEAAVVN